MKIIYTLLLSTIPLIGIAQVGIGTSTPNSSSILELKSESSGFLPPRIKLKNNLDIATIPTPEKGLMVYNLTPDKSQSETGLEYNGMVVWNGEEWRTLNDLYLGPGNVQVLDCANAKLYPPTYNQGVPYNGVLEIPYIGSNGGLIPAVTLGPSNGLTAKIKSGNLYIGNGTIQYNVTGTPTQGSPITSIFTATIGNKTCDATIGAGETIDQGASKFHKVNNIDARVAGSGDQTNGTQNIGWFSHYDDNLPIVGGKLRLDGYFHNSSNADAGRVSWNPRIVNITDKPVKIWFSSFSSQENFDGSNIVLAPGKYFNLDNGVYLNRGNDDILSSPTTTVGQSGANRNEIVTLDFALDERWYRAFYFAYIDNKDNNNRNTAPFAERVVFISIQRLF